MYAQFWTSLSKQTTSTWINQKYIYKKIFNMSKFSPFTILQLDVDGITLEN